VIVRLHKPEVPLYETLLYFHLLGVFLIVGGAAIATAIGIKLSKTARPHTVAELSRLSTIAERYVITPGAILAIVAGSWLVHKGGYRYGSFWVIGSYVLWVTALTIGWAILGRHTTRIHRRARQLVADGVDESPELQREAAAPSAMIFGLGQNVILLAFIYLMVVKPGA
jgi:uncharacterized membrane protein